MQRQMQEIGEVSTQFFDFTDDLLPFKLRSGEELDAVRVAYETYGALSKNGDNAVLLFHALTGSQHAAGFNAAVDGVGGLWTNECQTGWWNDFIGSGKALDTDDLFVICANFLGGCYGSSGPTSARPGAPDEIYGADFPHVSVSDMVDSQVALLDHLGVQTLHAVVGASIGALMCVNLATRYPDRVKNVIAIAGGVRVTPLQQIQNLEQIRAIESDPNFNGGRYTADKRPDAGLSFARMISHKNFVSLEAMRDRAGDALRKNGADLQWYEIATPLESYLIYQGVKFVKRFDANSYLRIVEAWQKFDLLAEAGAADFNALFARCQKQKYLLFSIDSDVCFYPDEQNNTVNLLRQAGVYATWVTVNSSKGHDSFLLEPDLYSPHLKYQLEL